MDDLPDAPALREDPPPGPAAAPPAPRRARSKRRRTQRGLSGSPGDRRGLFDVLPVRLFVLDAFDVVREVNAHAARELGYSPEELIGRPVLDLFPPDLRASVRENLRGVRAEPGTIHRWEARKICKDGTVQSVQETVRAVERAPGELAVIVACEDISERKAWDAHNVRYQRELKMLAGEVSQAEERERRRIADVLHMDLGHRLAMVKLELELGMETAQDTQARGAISTAIATLGEAIQVTRTLTADLCSPVLYELGLEPALRGAAAQMAEAHGMPCGFETDDLPKPLEQAHAVILFRVVLELLANVAKHANARAARIALLRDGDEIVISVEDDGDGMAVEDESPASAHASVGLFGIRERLAYIGGSTRISSAVSCGTRVVIRAPLDVLDAVPGGAPESGP